jgi:hypothetical protein
VPKKRKSRAIQSPPEYTVEFMGREYTTTGPIDASVRIRQMIEFNNFGASECGVRFPIRLNDRILGYVTYNGRVWEGSPGDARLVYDPESPERN